MKKLGLLFLLLELLAGCATPRRAVVLVSIDGFHPDFYSEARFKTPVLKSLVAAGASASGVVPIYPSVTYPNHTALATGVTSGRHGIHSNRIFSLENGPSSVWYRNASALRSPALWDAATAAGKSVALINWPVTVGAQARWLIPEVVPESGFAMKEFWAGTLAHSTPGLIDEIQKDLGRKEGYLNALDQSSWLAEAAGSVLTRHHPDLLLLHIPYTDVIQHMTGRDSPETAEAIGAVDSMVARILEHLELKRDCLIVTGDHGFMTVTKTLHLNSLFVKRGWIQLEGDRIRNWKVIADVSGAQAAVYSRDPRLSDEIKRLLEKNAGTSYRVLTRTQLDELDAFPAALMAVEPADGISISRRATGPWIEDLPKPHGEHGFLPSHPKMQTGFIAAGNCASPSVALGSIRILDVAPTVAREAGFEMPDALGKALKLKTP